MKTIKLSRINLLLIIIALVMACADTSNKTENETNVYTFTELSDSAIVNAINNELALNSQIPAQTVTVDVKKGVVTLKGNTDNLLDKTKIEEVASSVKGVKAVINEINIPASNYADKEIEEWINDRLLYDPVVESFELSTNVNNGVATLNGVVESWAEKAHAGDLARETKGVRKVFNDININFERKRTDDELKQDLKAFFRNIVFVDDEQLIIQVKDKTASFDGIVGSLKEKNYVKVHAHIPGIDSVNVTGLEVKLWARDPMLRKTKYVDKPDEKIKKAIKLVLRLKSLKEHKNIDINVKDGIVTLQGEVTGYFIKNDAAKYTESVVGVVAVKNAIKVTPQQTINKTAILDNVRTAIKTNPKLEDQQIEVTSERNQIRLEGFVDSPELIAEMNKISTLQPGVTKIENELKIKNKKNHYPPLIYGYAVPGQINKEFHRDIKNNALETEVYKQFFWSPYINGNKINVKTNGKVVTLKGKVETRAESILAESNAYQAGAKEVKNKITIGKH